jgi:hypothetical protein
VEGPCSVVQLPDSPLTDAVVCVAYSWIVCLRIDVKKFETMALIGRRTNVSIPHHMIGRGRTQIKTYHHQMRKGIDHYTHQKTFSSPSRHSGNVESSEGGITPQNLCLYKDVRGGRPHYYAIFFHASDRFPPASKRHMCYRLPAPERRSRPS